MLIYFVLAALAAPVSAASGVAASPGAAEAAQLPATSLASDHNLASEHNLAHNRTWLTLLGYHSPDGGAARSDVISPEFFLSPNGARDPLAELIATEAAMAAPETGNPDLHAQCRFRGRYLWLKTQNALPADLPVMPCPAFETWAGGEKPTGASIIFASGDLGNPATFYGHMLLRMTTDNQKPGDALLESTINNGALFPPDENGIVYVMRGLSGGYRATYSHTAFYLHLHRYSEKQMRDIWEYKLDLTPAQTDLLVAHAFELQGVFNKYYFMRQNCAYRIADLVNVAIGQDVVEESKPWVMPVDVLDRMMETRNGGVPLVKSAERIDSRRTRLRNKYAALTPAERASLTAYLRVPKAGIEDRVATLDANGQARVIETLLDYYSVASIDAKGKDKPSEAAPEEQALKRDLLVARMSRPAGRADFGTPVVPLKPHEGQKSTLLQISLGDNSTLGGRAQIRFRFAYNDFLSITPGALPYSELSFGDIRVEGDNHKYTLRTFDVMRITTLNLSQSGLPNEGGLAWRVRLGAEQEQLACDDCLTGFVEGGVGKSVWLGKSTVGYALAVARLAGSDTRYGALKAGITSGLIFNSGKPWRTAAEVTAWQNLSKGGRPLAQAKLETRYALNQNADIGLEIHAEDDGVRTTTDVRSTLSIYW